MLLIVLLWFGISAPLSAIGAYFGSKHGVREYMIPVLEILTSHSGHEASCSCQPDTSPDTPHPQILASMGRFIIQIGLAHMTTTF